jgi:hypothetical protein
MVSAKGASSAKRFSHFASERLTYSNHSESVRLPSTIVSRPPFYWKGIPSSCNGVLFFDDPRFVFARTVVSCNLRVIKILDGIVYFFELSDALDPVNNLKRKG